MKCLHLDTRSLDPTGCGSARWIIGGIPALSAFAITGRTGSRENHSPMKPPDRTHRSTDSLDGHPMTDRRYW